MMKEGQHLEWKANWKDEFLRAICGFANAEGGALHIGRSDQGEVVGLPDAALREAILNAIVHRDYANGSPIQIRVYENRLQIWNPCVLPEGWTVKDLLKAHPSSPLNPCIVHVFFRSGEIETWGRGIERILAACNEAGTPHPIVEFDGTGLTMEFQFSEDYKMTMGSTFFPVRVESGVKVTPQVTPQVKTVLFAMIRNEQSRGELQRISGIKDREHFRKAYLEPLLASASL